jgi:hypothetical protein
VKGDDEGMVDRLKDALLLEHLVDVTATENVVLRVRVCTWVGGRAVRKLRMRRLERTERGEEQDKTHATAAGAKRAWGRSKTRRGAECGRLLETTLGAVTLRANH